MLRPPAPFFIFEKGLAPLLIPVSSGDALTGAAPNGATWEVAGGNPTITTYGG
jgi:hypothetical protein